MQFFTISRISDHQALTPEGFLVIHDTVIARCGLQFYRDHELPDVAADNHGWIRVARDEEEVFRPESVASFEGKPLTDDHPSDEVHPGNWANLAIGFVRNVRRGKGINADCLVADLMVTTQRGIDAIRRGKRALSCGYAAAYEQSTPGHARQTKIVGNHVSLVDEGRCGARCVILDGAPHYNADAKPPMRVRARRMALVTVWVAGRAVAKVRDAWEESQHPRGQPGNAGQFGPGGGAPKSVAAVGPSMPAPLPPEAKTKAGRARHTEIKELANRVAIATRSLPQALAWITMPDLRKAIDDLHRLRTPENAGKLSKEDRATHQTLQDEIARRWRENREAREKRADDYVYMSDEEFKAATRLTIDGDSAMKIGMKKQLGLLPPAHIGRMAGQSMRVSAVKEIPPMSLDHPYAPGMRPAGLFSPAEGHVQVADQVTLPDGTVRMLNQRDATLRHEVGHAIDDITGLSWDGALINAVDDAVKQMTPEERRAAAYWLGEQPGVVSESASIDARRKETFAELYAYAYDEDADGHTSFGGLSGARRFELFGKAKAIMRAKLADAFGDRTLDKLREAA